MSPQKEVVLKIWTAVYNQSTDHKLLLRISILPKPFIKNILLQNILLQNSIKLSIQQLYVCKIQDILGDLLGSIKV